MIELTFNNLALPVAFSGIVLQIVIGLLTPGRKGSMKASKTLEFAGVRPEEAMKRFVDRLGYEGFNITEPKGNFHLIAKRKKSPFSGLPYSIQSHANKIVHAELKVTPNAQGSTVEISLWMKDWVYQDTGEGAFIDYALERICTGDLKTPAPVVENLSGNAVSALYLGGVGLFVALLPFTSVVMASKLQLVFALAGQQFVFSLVLSALAFRDVLMKKGEMKGIWQAFLGMGLGLLGVVISLAMFILK